MCIYHEWRRYDASRGSKLPSLVLVTVASLNRTDSIWLLGSSWDFSSRLGKVPYPALYRNVQFTLRSVDRECSELPSSFVSEQCQMLEVPRYLVCAQHAASPTWTVDQWTVEGLSHDVAQVRTRLADPGAAGLPEGRANTPPSSMAASLIKSTFKPDISQPKDISTSPRRRHTPAKRYLLPLITSSAQAKVADICLYPENYIVFQPAATLIPRRAQRYRQTPREPTYALVVTGHRRDHSNGRLCERVG